MKVLPRDKRVREEMLAFMQVPTLTTQYGSFKEVIKGALREQKQKLQRSIYPFPITLLHYCIQSVETSWPKDTKNTL